MAGTRTRFPIRTIVPPRYVVEEITVFRKPFKSKARGCGPPSILVPRRGIEFTINCRFPAFATSNLPG
jgi:hypothetical protein